MKGCRINHEPDDDIWIATHGAPDVRFALAGSPATSLAARHILAHDPETAIRGVLLSVGDLPEEVVASMLIAFPEDFAFIATHPNAPRTAMEKVPARTLSNFALETYATRTRMSSQATDDLFVAVDSLRATDTTLGEILESMR